MIRMNLEILDPGRSDAPRLRALSALFLALADGTLNELDKLASQAGAGQIGMAKTPERLAGMPQAVAAPYAGQTLDAADNPATGIPTPREAFADAGHANPLPDPATVGFGSHGSAALDADALKLEQLAGAGAAGATLQDVGLAPVIPPPPGAALPNVPPVPAPGAGNVATSIPSTSSLPPAPPSAPNAAAVSAPAGVDLDTEGVPWDSSIHASSKTKIANGTWKVKRGTSEVYLKERKEQLKAAVSAGNAGAAGAPVTPPPGALPPPVPVGAPPVGNVPGAMTTPQASPATTNDTAGSNAITMTTLLPRVTKAISAGLLTADSAGAIVSELSGGKIVAVAMLAVAPQLIPQFAARLDALGIPQ